MIYRSVLKNVDVGPRSHVEDIYCLHGFLLQTFKCTIISQPMLKNVHIKIIIINVKCKNKLYLIKPILYGSKEPPTPSGYP